MTERIALLRMRLTTSPIPIGLTPGHLSMAISLQAISGCRGSGSTKLELILLAVLANASRSMGCRLCHNLDFCPDKDISTIIYISELIICIS